MKWSFSAFFNIRLSSPYLKHWLLNTEGSIIATGIFLLRLSIYNSRKNISNTSYMLITEDLIIQNFGDFCGLIQKRRTLGISQSQLIFFGQCQELGLLQFSLRVNLHYVLILVQCQIVSVQQLFFFFGLRKNLMKGFDRKLQEIHIQHCQIRNEKMQLITHDFALATFCSLHRQADKVSSATRHAQQKIMVPVKYKNVNVLSVLSFH